jgi:hypothetical protein
MVLNKMLGKTQLIVLLCSLIFYAYVALCFVLGKQARLLSENREVIVDAIIIFVLASLHFDFLVFQGFFIQSNFTYIDLGYVFMFGIIMVYLVNWIFVIDMIPSVNPYKKHTSRYARSISFVQLILLALILTVLAINLIFHILNALLLIDVVLFVSFWTNRIENKNALISHYSKHQ